MKITIRLLTALGIALAVSAGAIHDANARGGGVHRKSIGIQCTGFCYGASQTRITYMKGYVKKDGTVVQSYTR